MTVAIAADHGGYPLKEAILAYLREQGIPARDFGTTDTNSVDYVPFAEQVAKAVAAGEYTFGILCCGTGIGMAMAANKIRGVRAANCMDYYATRMTRLHNNANVLCLGARVLGVDSALSFVEAFLNTPFSGEERHTRRIQQIQDLENETVGAASGRPQTQ